VLVRT